MTNLLQHCLEWVYKKFKKNTAKMLIYTGTIGWALSSTAQIGAILFNPKIPSEQKGFLVPQEFADALTNIGSFFLITQATKSVISSLASTGKIAPSKVRAFLNENKERYGNQVGKISFDLDKVLEKEPHFPKESYYSYKNYAATVGTIGASIFSSNIVTPVIRNYTASNIQKKYLDNRPQKPTNNMTI